MSRREGAGAGTAPPVATGTPPLPPGDRRSDDRVAASGRRSRPALQHAQHWLATVGGAPASPRTALAGAPAPSRIAVDGAGRGGDVPAAELDGVHDQRRDLVEGHTFGPAVRQWGGVLVAGEGALAEAAEQPHHGEVELP